MADPNDVNKRFARSLDFYLVQDFASAIEDLNQAIIIEDHFFPVYFNRALIRYKQLEYQKMEKSMIESRSGREECRESCGL